MSFLLFNFFFLRDSSGPTTSLALPLPLTRVLVWAFLLVLLAQPSLLETFLSFRHFLLLSAALASSSLLG